MVRYLFDGTVDSSFGTNGITVTEEENGLACSDALLQANGKILLSGSGYIPAEQKNVSVFARYYGDESKRQIIATRIKRWLQHHGIIWQMDNNVRYYNVQRSNDGGITYQPVAKIYNNHQLQYNYEDVAGKSNDLYRVAAVGKDGSRSYSNSVLISNESSVSVFPNPAHGDIQVLHLITANVKSLVSVTDLNGNVCKTSVSSGTSLLVATSNLKPGNYLLKIQNGTTITTQPFIKQ